MTPETREELVRAIEAADVRSASAMTCDVYLAHPVDRQFARIDAIAPIIERMVAERVAAETERCAGVLRPALFPTDYNYKQALAAIRSATR